MADVAPKITRPYRQREFVKPSNSVIKQLFGQPDRSETKSMINEMVKSETQRLITRWDFDLRQQSFAENLNKEAGEKVFDAPILKQRRFVWERADRQNVPDFYSRSFHPHYSEARLQQNLARNSQENQFLLPKTERKQRISPQPLSPRNTNHLLPSSSISQQPITIKSPKKISSEHVRLSSACIAPSAVRAPLLSRLLSPLPSETEETLSDCTKQVEQVPQPTNSFPPHISTKQSLPTAFEKPSSSKSNDSRQFPQKRKLSCTKVAGKQLKITDVIPARKIRMKPAKTTSRKQSNKLHTATSSAQ